jgi:hypothetical protein
VQHGAGDDGTPVPDGVDGGVRTRRGGAVALRTRDVSDALASEVEYVLNREAGPRRVVNHN